MQAFRDVEAYVLSSEEMVREALLQPFNAFVAFSPLVKDHVNDLVVFADVFCGHGHELVDDLGEEHDIAPGVLSDPHYQFYNCFFVLQRQSVGLFDAS